MMEQAVSCKWRGLITVHVLSIGATKPSNVESCDTLPFDFSEVSKGNQMRNSHL